MANLMTVACQLYYLCGSSSMICEMVCLIQTLQNNAVTFLVYGWMFVGMDKVDDNGGFCVGILVGDLPCCKLSVCERSMTTCYLIALPNGGVAQQPVEEYCTSIIIIISFTSLALEGVHRRLGLYKGLTLVAICKLLEITKARPVQGAYPCICKLLEITKARLVQGAYPCICKFNYLIGYNYISTQYQCPLLRFTTNSYPSAPA